MWLKMSLIKVWLSVFGLAMVCGSADAVDRYQIGYDTLWSQYPEIKLDIFVYRHMGVCVHRTNLGLLHYHDVLKVCQLPDSHFDKSTFEAPYLPYPLVIDSAWDSGKVAHAIQAAGYQIIEQELDLPDNTLN